MRYATILKFQVNAFASKSSPVAILRASLAILIVILCAGFPGRSQPKPDYEQSVNSNITAGAFNPAAPQSLLDAIFPSTGRNIRNFETNDLGTVVIGSGAGNPESDSVVQIKNSVITKLAAVGDPVPGKPGRVFTGFGFQSLNNRDEAAFLASSLPPGDGSGCQLFWDYSNCAAGIFIHSNGLMRQIASTGDTAPGTGGLIFTSFAQARLNNSGMLVFSASLGFARGDYESDGLFLFTGKNIVKVVVRGDNLPGLGSIPYTSAFVLDDRGRVTFSSKGLIARYEVGEITKVVASGDPVDGGGFFPNGADVYSLSANSKDELAFQVRVLDPLRGYRANPNENGVYLLKRDGRIIRIMTDGDPSPAGGNFSFIYTREVSHIEQVAVMDLYPLLNEAGNVLFSAPVRGGSSIGGIFLYSDGQLRKVVTDGDPVPFDPALQFRLGTGGAIPLNTRFSYDPLGRILFTAGLPITYGQINKSGIFVVSDGTIAPVAVIGDAVSRAAGENLTGPDESGWIYRTNMLGEVVFSSQLCCGIYTKSVIRASLPSPEISNSGFETRGSAGLPQFWTTSWTNFGRGDGSQYDTGGADSFEGKSTLRLHVPDSGGGVFVLSNPVPITSRTFYQLSCRMRFNLKSPTDAIFFSVIQYDGSGRDLGITEVKMLQGDDYWTWQAETLVFQTAPNAAAIRIRFGLSASSESYLDMDAVGQLYIP